MIAFIQNTNESQADYIDRLVYGNGASLMAQWAKNHPAMQETQEMWI